MRGNENGTCHRNQTLAKWGKPFIKFGRVNKSSNTISQTAISKTDIFKFCYYDIFIFH
jgi:hypothetical protein